MLLNVNDTRVEIPMQDLVLELYNQTDGKNSGRFFFAFNHTDLETQLKCLLQEGDEQDKTRKNLLALARKLVPGRLARIGFSEETKDYCHSGRKNYTNEVNDLFKTGENGFYFSAERSVDEKYLILTPLIDTEGYLYIRHLVRMPLRVRERREKHFGPIHLDYHADTEGMLLIANPGEREHIIPQTIISDLNTYVKKEEADKKSLGMLKQALNQR